MTLKQIEAMTPSLELDEVVSEHIMGFTTPRFEPSREAGDAFKVAEVMRSHGHHLLLRDIGKKDERRWRAVFVVGLFGEDQEVSGVAVWSDPQTAICKAALIAFCTARGDSGMTPPNRPEITQAAKTMLLRGPDGEEYDEKKTPWGADDAKD